MLFSVLSLFVGSAFAINHPDPRVKRRQIRLGAAFEEIAPYIQEIEVKKGEHFLEVNVWGLAATGCFDAQEYAVNRHATYTEVIPRFHRTQTTKNCDETKLKEFHAKAAELDPRDAASYHVRVMGFRSWHERRVEVDPETLALMHAAPVAPPPPAAVKAAPKPIPPPAAVVAPPPPTTLGEELD